MLPSLTGLLPVYEYSVFWWTVVQLFHFNVFHHKNLKIRPILISNRFIMLYSCVLVMLIAVSIMSINVDKFLIHQI